MDELSLIEKMVGDVAGVISLQFKSEETQWKDEEWEEFPEPEVVAKPEKKEGDEDEEEAPAENNEEEDGEKKVVFNPAEFKWTISNGRPKNLPQLFQDFKNNCVQEEKRFDEFAASEHEAISSSLDKFAGRMIEESANHSIYQ